MPTLEKAMIGNEVVARPQHEAQRIAGHIADREVVVSGIGPESSDVFKDVPEHIAEEVFDAYDSMRSHVSALNEGRGGVPENKRLAKEYIPDDIETFADRVKALVPVYEALGQVEGAKPKMIFIPIGLKHGEKQTIMSGQSVEDVDPTMAPKSKKKDTGPQSKGIMRHTKYKSSNDEFYWDVAVVDDGDFPLFHGISPNGEQGADKDEIVNKIVALPGVKERLPRNYTNEDVIRQVSPTEDVYLAHQLDKMLTFRPTNANGNKDHVYQLDAYDTYTLGNNSRKDSEGKPMMLAMGWDNKSRKVYLGDIPNDETDMIDERIGIRPVFMGREYVGDPQQQAREALQESNRPILGRASVTTITGESGYPYKDETSNEDESALIENLTPETQKKLEEAPEAYRHAIARAYKKTGSAKTEAKPGTKAIIPSAEQLVGDALFLKQWYEAAVQGGDNPEIVYLPESTSTKQEWAQGVMSTAHKAAITSAKGYAALAAMGSGQGNGFRMHVISRPRKGFRSVTMVNGKPSVIAF